MFGANHDTAPGDTEADRTGTGPNKNHSVLKRPDPGRTASNPSKMNTYAKWAAKPCRMRTYKIIGLKVSYNEHLQKMGVEVLLLPSGHLRRELDSKSATQHFQLPILAEGSPGKYLVIGVLG